MNNPFDNTPAAPVVNLMQPENTAAPDFTKDSVAPNFFDDSAAQAASGPSVGAASGGIKGFLGRPWRGQEKLWKAYWLYGVIGAIILQVLLSVLGSIGFVGLILGGALTLVFAVWSNVSIWRCAWNANAKFWGYLVRVLVVLSIPTYLFMIIGLFGLGALGGAASGLKVEQPAVVQDADVVAPVVPEAPAAPLQAPVPAPAAPVSACEQRMIDFATQNGADPKAYVAQNQAYLVECNKAMQAGAK